MNKQGAATLLIIFIGIFVTLSSYFGYTFLFDQEKDYFGEGLENCEPKTLGVGPLPLIGEGKANITGIEIHNISGGEESELCCMVFKNGRNESYKICEKRDEKGIIEKQKVFSDEGVVYEFLTKENESCLYTYGPEGITEECDEDPSELFYGFIHDNDTTSQNITEEETKTIDDLGLFDYIFGGSGGSSGGSSDEADPEESVSLSGYWGINGTSLNNKKESVSFYDENFSEFPVLEGRIYLVVRDSGLRECIDCVMFEIREEDPVTDDSIREINGSVDSNGTVFAETKIKNDDLYMGGQGGGMGGTSVIGDEESYPLVNESETYEFYFVLYDSLSGGDKIYEGKDTQDGYLIMTLNRSSQPVLQGNCTHFDNICPSNCNDFEDADCAGEPPTQINIPSYMDEVKEYTDYDNIVYIDPNQSISGTGSSPSSPLSSWSEVDFQNNTAYVQKRNTTETQTSGFDINPSNVLVGAYGEGEKPVVSGPVIVIGDNVTVRDMEINGGGLEINHPSPHPLHTVLFNNRVHGQGIGSAGYYSRILNNEVYDVPTDGIFVQYAHDVEIAGNYIHDVNQMFHETSNQSVADGDAIQLVDTSNWWVHHNFLDRTDTGNKFGFIATTDFPDMPQYGTLEYNHFKGPLNIGEGGASIFLGGEPEMVHVRYNKIEGPSPWAIHKYPDMHFYGNIINGTSNGVDSYYQIHSSYIYNNVFVNIPGAVFSGGMIYSYNNIFDDRNDTSGIVEEGNNIYLSDYSYGDVFVDYNKGDYRLSNNSPAIDAGSWETFFSTAFDTDIHGSDVPQNNSIDAGAFQTNLSTPACSSDSECNDSNVCTLNTCINGSCSSTSVANGTSCTDDGDACTVDECQEGLCTHDPVTQCIGGDGCCPSGCSYENDSDCPDLTCDNPVDFDGNCTSGCNASQDADCADWPWEVSRPKILSSEDFSNESKTYINPDCSTEEGCCGGGNESCPLPSLFEVTFQNNNAYLIKRGKNVSVSEPWINQIKNNSLLGAYGNISESKPIIVPRLETIGDNITIRDVEITSGTTWGLRIDSNYLTLYNMSLHGINMTSPMEYCIDAEGVSNSLRILHSEIYNCGLEAYYGSGDLLEVGNTKIYNVGLYCIESPGSCGGDAFQLYDTCKGIWFYDSDINYSFNTRKFILINTCDGQRNALFERNNLTIGGNQPIFHFYADPFIVRYNNIRHVSNFNYTNEVATAKPIYPVGPYAQTREIYGNIFENWGSDPVFTTSNNSLIANNLFMDYITAIRDSNPGYIYNNIFAENGTAIESSGSEISHNLFISDSEVQGSNYITSSVGEIFNDFLNRDYSLALGSPAVDSGRSIRDNVSSIASEGIVINREGNQPPTLGVNMGPYQKDPE